ncbi:MAG: C25 family cysteine peptidase [Candidatus Helarchaeota archaeon]
MKEWFSFETHKKRAPMRGAKDIDFPAEKVVQRTFKSEGTYLLDISYNPKGMWYKDIMAKIGKKTASVTALEMPESGVILEPGKPMLPIEGLFVALPSGAELKDIMIGEVEQLEFPGKVDIIPAPVPTKDNGKYDWKEPEYKRDSKIYRSDDEYPKDFFKLQSVNYIGSVQIAHIIMYPIHYRPKSKKLLVYPTIQLKIEYSPGIHIDIMRGLPTRAPPAPPEEAIKPVTPIAPQIQSEYRNLILNLDAVENLRMRTDGGTPLRRIVQPVNAGSLSNTSNKAQYLIITTPLLVKSVEPLAKSKEAQGMTTKIVTPQQIYDEFRESREPKFKSIKDFILYTYDHWEEPPEYVLLVGEIEKIPTHHDRTYDCPSDWYYANLIGDIGPDISVGRIAINNPERLSQYISKILEYEQDSKQLWTKRVLLTAYERDDYIDCSEDIAEILKKARGLRIIKKYGGESTKREVIDEINKGCAIINYRGHGSEWEWQSSNGLRVEDAQKLKNKGKPSVVFSICCLNNAIDVSKECFGEAFVESANGAVAFIGATRPSFTQTNHHFDRYIFRAIVNKGLRRVGKIFNYATIELYRNFPDPYTKENIAMYLLLGDPSLEIKFPN